MPKTNYNDAAFWEEKYKTNSCEHLEWICQPELVFTSISEFLNYQSMQQVLQIGCGTSNFSSKLKKQIQSRSQQTEITCIDFSKQLIKKLRSSKRLNELNFVSADMKNMSTVLTQQFDYIFDKGTIDCLFCSDNFIKEVILGLRQCFKLLKPGGKLIVVTHGKQKNRYYLFRNKLVPFKVQQKTIPKSRDQPEVNFYICQKPSQGEGTNQEEGVIDIQHQKSEQDIKHDDVKKQEDTKKKKGDFILDDKKSKKQQKGGDFILSQQTEKKNTDLPTSFILEQKGKKKQNKQDANFILNDEQQQQEEGEVQVQEQEDDKNNKGGQGEVKQTQQGNKQDEGNFILKQAEYQNQFDES